MDGNITDPNAQEHLAEAIDDHLRKIELSDDENIEPTESQDHKITTNEPIDAKVNDEQKNKEGNVQQETENNIEGETQNRTMEENIEKEEKTNVEDQNRGQITDKEKEKSEDLQNQLHEVVKSGIENIKDTENKDLIHEKTGKEAEEGDEKNIEAKEEGKETEGEMKKTTEDETADQEGKISEEPTMNSDIILDKIIDEELENIINRPNSEAENVTQEKINEQQLKENLEQKVEASVEDNAEIKSEKNDKEAENVTQERPKENIEEKEKIEESTKNATEENYIEQEPIKNTERKEEPSKGDVKTEIKTEENEPELEDTDVDEWKSAIGDPTEETQGILRGKDATTERQDKPSKSLDGTYSAGYSIQDDVRFLKFIANLNNIECTCNRAGNDFVLDVRDSNNHFRGCPSTLSPRDIESVKVLFLTKHLPVCKRFLTVDERKVLRNILKTTPYYQVEFYIRHQPYEVKSESNELVNHHMVEEREFPKRSDQQNFRKSKKTILDDLREILNPAPPPVDSNLNRFPKEEYKFGEKYEEKIKKRALDISEYPYDYPSTSGSTKTTNKDIVEERLILDLLNDLDAWRCFTFICICDVLEPFDEEREHNPAVKQLRAALLSGVPADQHQAMLAMIDKNLIYFEDLIKKQLVNKIEREREYMQMLKNGKLKKEQLYVDILTYKLKKSTRKDLPVIVNDMFKEMMRNNKDILKEMENKMNREDYLMARNINNQLGKRLNSGDLKLAFPKDELFERHIKDCMQAKILKEYDLIHSELEYELDRSNETTLRLFQDVLNRMDKDKVSGYDHIDQFFKDLYPSFDGTLGSDSLERRVGPKPRSPSAEKPGSSKKTSQRKTSLESDAGIIDDQAVRSVPNDIAKDVRNFPERQDKATGPISQQDELKRPEKKHKATDTEKIPRYPDEAMTSTRDFQTQTDHEINRARAGPSEIHRPPKREPKSEGSKAGPSRNSSKAERRRTSITSETLGKELDALRKPEGLRNEMDSMMAELWNTEDDKLKLIRELANELRKFDLAQQDPGEKASDTKKSYLEFKDEMNSKLKPSRKPTRTPPSSQARASNKPVQPTAPSRDTQETFLSLYDGHFRYYILETPMTDQRLELFHDSFYGHQKPLAEVRIKSDRKQIRTDVEMKS